MDLEQEPQRAAQLCCEAQARLVHRVARVAPEDVRAPSLLPGWTVGHVLTHLARNADAHARRLSGALHGYDVPKYPSGQDQRCLEIDDGAGRPVEEIVADLHTSLTGLEEVFARCSAAGWPNGHFLGGGSYRRSWLPGAPAAGSGDASRRPGARLHPAGLAGGVCGLGPTRLVSHRSRQTPLHW